jgi:ParB family chromosome partitioning protein
MALDLSLLDQALPSRTPAADSGIAPRAALDLFEPDPNNPRFEADVQAFDQLVADIRVRGILQPIIVRETETGKLRIRFGERRYRAAVQLCLLDAPYLITDDERQFDDYAQVAENEQRHALQPLELATFIAKKLAAGETKRAVAAKLHLDPSAVTQLLALTGDVPAIILELYHSRRCRTPLYLYELRKIHAQNPELVQTLCGSATTIDRTFLARLANEVSEGVSTDHAKANTVSLTSLPSAVPKSGTKERGVAASDLQHPRKEAEDAVASKALPGALASRRFRPQLFGTIDGRPLLVELTMRPSAPERLHVRYLDGTLAEVSIGTILLTSVRDAD